MIVTREQNNDVAISLPETMATFGESRRLDPLLLRPSSHFSFPQGLFGFPEHTAFALVPTVQGGIYWLHDSSLTFLVVDPFHFFPGHSFDVPNDVLTAIGAESPRDVLILTIVTLGSESTTTANLQGPIALNPRVGLARQFVISDPAADLRAPFVLLQPAT